MLGDFPLSVVLLATDINASRDFYANKVGLRIVNDGPAGVAFKCGGESMLTISKSTTGTRDTQTQASWRVKDIRAEVAALRARGVKIEDYDTADLKTVDGIADIGFALIAWFIDPGKNCVGIMQVK